MRVALTNGRVSPAHPGKYRLLFSLIGNPLRDMDLFLMRGQDEAERVLGLGAPRERVFVTGTSLGSGTDRDFATVAYAWDGSPLWASRYDAGADDFHGPYRLKPRARSIRMDERAQSHTEPSSSESRAADPRFMDVQAGDYRLAPGSPAPAMKAGFREPARIPLR